MLFNEEKDIHFSPLDKLLLFLDDDAEEITDLPLEEVGEKLENEGIQADVVIDVMEEQRRNTLGDSLLDQLYELQFLGESHRF